MTRSPLIAALLSLTFGLQLMLAGGGAACIDGGHGTTSPADGASELAMADMNMPMAMDTSIPTDDDPAPCDQPSAPGGCQLMGPCAGGFIAIAAADFDRPAPAPSRVVGFVSPAPHLQTFPPEPPPPRA